MEEEMKKLERVGEMAKFNHIEQMYQNAKNNLTILEESIKETEDKLEEISNRIIEIEAILKNKELSSEERINAYDELQGQDVVIESLVNKQEERKLALVSSKEKIAEVQELFVNAMPSYAKVIDDMVNKTMEQKAKVIDVEHITKMRRVETNMKHYTTLYENIKVNPDLEKAFNDLVKYPANCMDLLEKEQDGSITKDEAVVLSAFKEEYHRNKDILREFCDNNGMKDQEFDSLEDSLFKDPELSAEEHLLFTLKALRLNRDKIQEDQDKYIKYFNGKVKDEDLEIETKVEEKVEVKEETKSENYYHAPASLENQEKEVQEKDIQYPDDIMEGYKPTLFERMSGFFTKSRDRVKEFFDKRKADKEIVPKEMITNKAEKETVEMPLNETTDNAKTLHDEELELLKNSELIKDELDKVYEKIETFREKVARESEKSEEEIKRDEETKPTTKAKEEVENEQEL